MSRQFDIKTIGLLAYDDMQPLDLVGPLDVFGAANAGAGGVPPYRLYIPLAPDAARAENGLVVVPTHALDDAPSLDTLPIPGGVGARHRMSRQCAAPVPRGRTVFRISAASEPFASSWRSRPSHAESRTRTKPVVLRIGRSR